MDRIACVELPALSLQVLLQRQPTWRDLAAVVVESERPQGRVLLGNAHARRCGITSGMTLAGAQSLAPELRAGTVSVEERQQALADLHLLLCEFSPRVDPPEAEPMTSRPTGAFFVDPSGLVPLFGSLEQWSAQIVERLQHHGWRASVIVGFQRFRCHAIARSRRPGTAWVLADPHTELRVAHGVPLVRLELSSDLRDILHVLGLRTLGELIQIPAAEVRGRLGPEAWALHRAMTSDFTTLQPRVPTEPICDTLVLEPPDGEHTRILFGLKSLLHRALGRLAARGQALQSLRVCLTLDHGPAHEERIEPAAPTLDALMLVDLVRLRLEGLELPAPVTEVTIELEGLQADPQQLALFRTRQRRDLEAAARALARVRAAFGPAAVTRATLRAAHLPEAGFAWDSTTTISAPHPRPPARETAMLVRRVFKPPLPLRDHAPFEHMQGPFRISGGWWVRLVERDYYYAHTRDDEILWIYYDRPRRRWFIHGLID